MKTIDNLHKLTFDRKLYKPDVFALQQKLHFIFFWHENKYSSPHLTHAWAANLNENLSPRNKNHI